MVEREVEIVNQLGLHARAAAKLVHLAGQYPCDVEVQLGKTTVDAKSILGLLLLAAPVGTHLTLRCRGLRETEALEAISGLFSDRFGEDQ
ncbi:MAG TPA: HPr family phosphocarrier protein [Thermoanaerobaculia bacterium]|nr:HPr family phosphocarrier protein [Thermoanaerobaculia bacterium]